MQNEEEQISWRVKAANIFYTSKHNSVRDFIKKIGLKLLIGM